MDDCEGCSWKKRDPKKLDALITKLESENRDLKSQMQELQAQFDVFRRSMFNQNPVSVNHDPFIDDDIPF